LKFALDGRGVDEKGRGCEDGDERKSKKNKVKNEF
jgi:hypothetical protein